MNGHRTPDHGTRTSPRRSWAVAAAAVAAAAAIAVPAYLLTGNHSAGSGTATPAAGTSEVATNPAGTAPGGTDAPSQSAVRSVGTFDLLDGVAQGPPPSVPYLDGTTLRLPDATTITLPRMYDQFALLGGQILGAYDDGQGNEVLDVLTSTGTPVRSTHIQSTFALNGPSTLAAWADPDGELHTMWPGGTLSLGEHGTDATAVAVTGEGPCATGEASCTVYVNRSGDRGPQAVSSDGRVESVAPGAIKLNDVHARGLRAVQLSSSATGSCSGVYDPEVGSYSWKTCRNSLFRFSPDATHLLASDAYLDGLGLSSLTVLDVATGRALVTFRIRDGYIAQQGWEDETHALVVVSTPAGWEMLRLGLDGSRQRVAGPVARAADPTFEMLALPGNR